MLSKRTLKVIKYPLSCLLLFLLLDSMNIALFLIIFFGRLQSVIRSMHVIMLILLPDSKQMWFKRKTYNTKLNDLRIITGLRKSENSAERISICNGIEQQTLFACVWTDVIYLLL